MDSVTFFLGVNAGLTMYAIWQIWDLKADASPTINKKD